MLKRTKNSVNLGETPNCNPTIGEKNTLSTYEKTSTVKLGETPKCNPTLGEKKHCKPRREKYTVNLGEKKTL